MKRLLLLLFFPMVIFGQTSNTERFIDGPFKNRPVCSRNVSDTNAHEGDVYSDTDDGNAYKCSGGAWRIFGRKTINSTISPNPAVFDPNMIRIGSNGYVDIRAHGAYATFSSTTCNTTGGSSRVKLGAASNFKNGEYATCYNAGPSPTVSTPLAPKVTPSNHAGGMNAVNDIGGSTSYSYCIVAEDKFNGRTACSPVGTTSTGAVTLGLIAFTTTGCTRSNQTVSCTTSATHSFVPNQMVWTNQITDSTFNGSWLTASGTTGTTVKYLSGWDTRNGATTSSAVSGSNNLWGYKMNRISYSAVTNTLRYHIYGPNCPTTCNWMGQSVLLFWDDYGSTMGAGQTRPAWIPATAPSSAANEHFTFQISSGSGTTALTANANAGASVTANTILSDDGPAIKAACTAALPNNTTSEVLIPNATYNPYQINSFTDVGSYNCAIVLNGSILTANNTLAGATSISGEHGGGGIISFGYGSYPSITGTAFPLLYSYNGHYGQLRLDHVSVAPNVANGGLGIYEVTPLTTNFDSVTLASSNQGGYQDCIGQAVLFESHGAAFDFSVNRFTLASGSCTSSEYPGNSPVPTFVLTSTGSNAIGGINITQGWLLNRGSFDLEKKGLCSEGSGYNVNDVSSQQGMEPIFQISGSCVVAGTIETPISINNSGVADFPDPVLTVYGNIFGLVEIGNTGNGSISTSVITGNPIPGVSFINQTPATTGTNSQSKNETYGGVIDGNYVSAISATGTRAQAQTQMNEHFALGQGYSLFTNTSQPAAATCSTVSAGPPYTPSGTYQFQYTATFPPFNGQGPVSPISNSCTSNGASQQVVITIPRAIAGATGYELYWNNGLPDGSAGGAAMSGETGCSIPTSTSLIFYTTGTLCTGEIPSTGSSGAGPSGISSGKLWGQTFVLGATAAPTGVTNLTQFYMDSTALWPSFKPNGNAAYVIPGISGPIINGHNLCANGTSGAYMDCLTTQTIASGTAELGTSAIAARTCATVVTTAATGVTTTDTVSYSFNATPSGAYNTGLFVQSYVTTGNVSFLVCNPTAENLTPPAAALNWHVTR